MLSAGSHSTNIGQTIDDLDNLSYFDDSFTLRSTPISHHSTTGRVQQSYGRLSARCYPFVKEPLPLRHKSETDLSDSEYYMSCVADDYGDSVAQHSDIKSYAALSKQQDFIRRLPVHLSKYILGYLDSQSLVNCICVSKHWRILAEEVRNELRAQDITKDDIMLIQVIYYFLF